MIHLTKMTPKEYQHYLLTAIKDYANDKVKNGTWNAGESFEQAKKVFQELLPQGVATPTHFLYTVKSEDRPIGYTWFLCNNTKEAFIYDIVIFEEFQNKGYGTLTMKLLEQKAKNLGAKKISLHVFGSNQRALHVYQKVGYQITDYNLTKFIE